MKNIKFLLFYLLVSSFPYFYIFICFTNFTFTFTFLNSSSQRCHFFDFVYHINDKNTKWIFFFNSFFFIFCLSSVSSLSLLEGSKSSFLNSLKIANALSSISSLSKMYNFFNPNEISIDVIIFYLNVLYKSLF